MKMIFGRFFLLLGTSVNEKRKSKLMYKKILVTCFIIKIDEKNSNRALRMCLLQIQVTQILSYINVGGCSFWKIKKMNLGLVVTILTLHFILTKLRKIQNSFEGICPKKRGDTVQFSFFLMNCEDD